MSKKHTFKVGDKVAIAGDIDRDRYGKHHWISSVLDCTGVVTGVVSMGGGTGCQQLSVEWLGVDLGVSIVYHNSWLTYLGSTTE